MLGDELESMIAMGMHNTVACAEDEPRFAGAEIAAGDRGINEVLALSAGQSGEFACHIGRCGGVVDQNGPFFHAGQRAVCAQYDGTQVIVIAHAHEHQIGVAGRLAWREGAAMSELLDPVLRFAAIAVVNRDLVSGQGQMAGHRETHHPQAQKGDTGGRSRLVGFGIGAGHDQEVWVRDARNDKPNRKSDCGRPANRTLSPVRGAEGVQFNHE